ncbi:MAG: DUF47 family protein, partial [Candidatus Bathyarchaeota archaeon]|nr:DUF47 family protein [Candidatus Bathyarchaeota archaeon]
VSASDELVYAVEAKMAEEWKNAASHIENLCRLEDEADEARRVIAGYLASGILPPLNKVDLMNLVERVDTIADWCKECGKILEIVPIEEFADEFKELFIKFNRKTNQCAHALSKVMQLLYTDHQKALDGCYEVELVENEVDSIYAELLQSLYRSNLEPKTLMLAIELARSLEMIGDSCEDTSDLVRIVIVSTFH